MDLATLAIAAAQTSGGSRLLTEIAILLLAAFVGFQVISKVPNTLHTPLMSGTNAIHGIVVLGGMIAIAYADGVISRALILVAIVFGTINVVGGFLVTDRMLSMFKRKPEPKPEDADANADSDSDATS
jgi:NAD(P) transhydrogenase subunit alpha